MELRPLDLAGILERAIALYLRNFVAFVGITIVTIVPVAVVQYFVVLREQPQLEAALDLLQHPERITAGHTPRFFESPVTLALTVAAALFGYVMMAIAIGAVAAGVARVYRGQAVSFRACYEAVLARWPSVAGVVLAAVVALAVAYLANVLVAAIPVLAAAGFATSLLPLVAPLAVGGMLLTISFILLTLLVTSACALCAIVVEERPAIASLRLSVSRIFNRDEFGRALLCALAVSAVGLLGSAFVEVVPFSGLSHWPAAYVALDALERTLVVPFLALVLAIYYFDVRVRHEGFDLDADLAHVLPDTGEPVYAPTAYLSGKERALIKRFMERRDSLTPPRRRQIAAQLAAPVRERVPAELQRLEDEPLLERL